MANDLPQNPIPNPTPELRDQPARCPHCGVKLRNDFRWKQIFVGFILGIGFVWWLSSVSRQTESTGAPSQANQQTQRDSNQSEQKAEVPVDFSLPLTTKRAALVCPLGLVFDPQEGHGLQSAIDAHLSFFGHDEAMAKSGCQEWREGLDISLTDEGEKRAKELQSSKRCGMVGFNDGLSLVFSCDLKNRVDANGGEAAAPPDLNNFSNTDEESIAPPPPHVDQPIPQTNSVQTTENTPQPNLTQPAPFSTSSGPGFNCAKARTQVEHMICDSPEISALDRQMLDVYHRALDGATPDETINIKDAAKNWRVHVRDACDTQECLLDAYRSRLSAMQAVAK